MKKKILLLIILLVPFLVSAKEEINYEWTKENSNGFLFLGEEDNQYLVFDEPNNGPRITYYQPNGKKVNSEYITPDTDNFFELWQKYGNRSGRNHLINEVDDQIVDLYVYDLEIELYNEETDSIDVLDYYNLSAKDQIKYTGKYHLLFELMADRTPDIEYSFIVKDNCIVVYKYVYSNTIRSYIEVYDFEENKLLSKRMDDSSIYSADMNAYGIYLLKEEYDDDEESILVELTKYDLKGKEEYTKDLTDEFYDNLDEDDLYYLEISDIDIVNNGFVVSLRDYCGISSGKAAASEYIEESPELTRFTTSYNPCYGSAVFDGLPGAFTFKEDVVGTQSIPGDARPTFILDKIYSRRMPIVLVKFNIDYEITTKVEGKGTVTAIGRSEANGLVTFKVEPQKGYVLSVVKVTDANGNVIEFTDYTFTMPSSDVLIEAVFVPENPYTADIAIVAVLLVAIAGGTLLLIGRKKINWLK